MSVIVLKKIEDLDQNKEKYVINFSASWCGPCKKFAPLFQELAKKYINVTFYKVDVDDIPDLTLFYNVKKMPTFLFFENGQIKTTVTGANESDIIKALEKLNEIDKNQIKFALNSV